MLKDQKRKMKAGLSQRMRDEAMARQCPWCKRKAAISKKRDGDCLVLWCRYCDWEDCVWLSNKA